jgi:hypothetical protein
VHGYFCYVHNSFLFVLVWAVSTTSIGDGRLEAGKATIVDEFSGLSSHNFVRLVLLCFCCFIVSFCCEYLLFILRRILYKIEKTKLIHTLAMDS